MWNRKTSLCLTFLLLSSGRPAFAQSTQANSSRFTTYLNQGPTPDPFSSKGVITYTEEAPNLFYAPFALPLSRIAGRGGHIDAAPVDWFPFCAGNALLPQFSGSQLTANPFLVLQTNWLASPMTPLLQSRTRSLNCPGGSLNPYGDPATAPTTGLSAQLLRSFTLANGATAFAIVEGNGVQIDVLNTDLTVASIVAYATGIAATALTVEDFNGDGKPDLAVVNAGSGPSHPGSVSILLGNGDGTFQPAVTAFSGNGLFSVATGHFNNDSYLDLVVTGASAMTVLLGDGHGGFQQGPAVATVGLAPAVADVNHDGFDDIVIGESIVNHSDNPGGVLLGNGDGTFQPIISFPSPPAGSLFLGFVSLAIGDFDQDGHLDVAGLAPNYLAILKGKGDGTFQLASTYAAPLFESGPDSIIISDLDGDGNLDVAIGNGDTNVIGPSVDTHTVFFLLGNGDCTLQGAPYVGVGQAIGAGLSGLAGADFNSDQLPDVAMNDEDGQLYLSVNQGGFQFTNTPLVNSGFFSPIAADVNGDHIPDLVGTTGVYNTGGEALVLLGNGNGTFQPMKSYSVGGTALAIAVGDLNGDHKADLAVLTTASNGAGSVAVLLANGNGGFASPVSYPVGNYPTALAIGTLTASGALDIAVTNTGLGGAAGTVSILINNGNGTFQSAASPTTGVAPVALAAADLNGDNIVDLAVVYGSTTNTGVSLLFGNGDGSFQSAVALTTEVNPTSILVGDFDLDGVTDLAITHQNETTVMFGEGSGSFAPEAGMIAGYNQAGLALADFNKDSRPDLITGTVNGFLVFPGSSPLAVTPVPITLASAPSGLSLAIDGILCPAPCVVGLNPGETHTIGAAPTTQPSSTTTGLAYGFASWSDGGAASHTITVPTSAATYTATFNTQFLLTTQVVGNKPNIGGSIGINPPSQTGYYNAGTAVQLTANPSVGYFFVDWLGALSGSVNPQSITMSAPFEVTAGFGLNACAVAQGGPVNVADVQTMVNEALGVAAPANDLNGDGVVNAVDVQIVTNAALKLGCRTS
jgi:hypothetical protein